MAIGGRVGAQGPSVRKRKLRNENADEFPTISERKRRFRSRTDTDRLFVARNHGVPGRNGYEVAGPAGVFHAANRGSNG